MNQTAILGGFDDPVHDGQRGFRAALDALAHPGRLQRVALPRERPSSFGPAMAALALTLLDHDTPVWLAPGVADGAGYLRFHTGCPVTEDPASAEFALCGARELPALTTFAAGVQGYPDRSTTVLMDVNSLQHGRVLSLAGPGINGRGRLTVTGLPADFTARWSGNVLRFPLGIDLFLTSGDTICGLPRTTHIHSED